MAEIIETETSYAKGEKFEKLFAEFMKSDLGWDKYIIRSQQRGKANSKGSQVDIIAMRKDRTGKIMHRIGLCCYCLFILILIPSILLVELDEIEFPLFLILGIISLIFSLIGIYVMHISSKYHKQHAWVECKNRKVKADYEDVRKSIMELKDYKESGDKQYRYVAHYFVSANGFMENALKFAIDNNIICYEHINGKFEEATYWK